MSNPSPNRPVNLFQNNTNPNNDDSRAPPTTTGVEPSPIAVSHHENITSIPPTEEMLISPYRMDHRFECLIDAAFADQSPMLEDTKYWVSAFPTQHPRGGFMKWYNFTTFFYCSTIIFNRIWLFNACIWEKHIFNAKFTFCEKGPDLSMQSTRSKSFLKCRYHQKDWHINKYIPF